MEGIGAVAILLLLFFTIYLFSRLGTAYKKLASLEYRLRQLEELLGGKAVKASAPRESSVIDKKRKDQVSNQAEKNTGAAPVVAPAADVRAQAKPEQAPVAAQSRVTPTNKASGTLWHSLEKQFSENYTGIIGTIIVIVGVAFLGVYGALKLSPFYRFLLVLAFAGLLFTCYFWLRNKKNLLKLGLWLRSAGGAIVLFDCLAASTVPALAFIESAFGATALLTAGILANLALGYLGRKQYFAALHVVLSLVALGFLPQTMPVLVIAALVTFVGILFSYRDRWPYHLVITLTSFFIFHLAWFFNIELTAFEHALAIGCILLVNLSAIFIHYRDIYANQNFALWPLIAHMLNWLYLGSSLLMHSTGSKYKTLLIFAAGILAFSIARRAKKLAIQWLYLTDTFVSYLVFLAATATLANWQLEGLTIMTLMLAESFIFLLVLGRERQKLLYDMACLCMHIVYLVFLGFASDYEKLDTWYMVTMLSVAALANLVFVIMVDRRMARPDNTFNLVDAPFGFFRFLLPQFSLSSTFLGILIVLLYNQVSYVAYSLYIVMPLVMVALVFRHRLKTSQAGLLGGLGIAMVSIPIVFFATQEQPVNQFNAFSEFIEFIPVFLTGLVALAFSNYARKERRYSAPAIYYLLANAIIALLVFCNPVSNMIPGVAFLLMAHVLAELARWLRRKEASFLQRWGNIDNHVFISAIILLVFFLVLHIAVHLQLEEYWGFLKARLAIELLAIATLGYWFFIDLSNQVRATIIEKIQPWFLEALLVFSFFTVLLEVPALYQPLVYIGMFSIAFVAGSLLQKARRLKVYSIVLTLFSAIFIGFLSSSYIEPSTDWHQQQWLLTLVAILAQGVFLFIIKDRSLLEEDSGFGWMFKFSNQVQRYRNWILFYPFFICIAAFLNYSFEKSLLTFLWTIESAIIFGLSIYLRDNGFRYFALGALVLIIIRLIVYDLETASALTRALVFLGTGGLMLLMNYLYNRYKDRIMPPEENEEEGKP